MLPLHNIVSPNSRLAHCTLQMRKICNYLVTYWKLSTSLLWVLWLWFLSMLKWAQSWELAVWLWRGTTRYQRTLLTKEKVAASSNCSLCDLLLFKTTLKQNHLFLPLFKLNRLRTTLEANNWEPRHERTWLLIKMLIMPLMIQCCPFNQKFQCLPY